MKKCDAVFSVLGSVNLKALFQMWANETIQDSYREPLENWSLKCGFAFRKGIWALLFENTSEEGVNYYRVLFYTGKGKYFKVVRKVRFRENSPVKVSAISVDEDLEIMVMRCSDNENKVLFRYCDIGDNPFTVNGLETLKKFVLPYSHRKLVLKKEMSVLFVRMHDKCKLYDRPFGADSLFYGTDSPINGEEYELSRICEAEGETAAQEPENVKTALEELQAMVGLDQIKEMIGQIVSLAELRKMAKEHGKSIPDMNLNLSFVGNPGTAKTTVARLFARIMKENNILSNGDLVEVGRADLIAKYEGQTAHLVREVFEKAKGNVLFIDEAYSLVENWENEFGDEAITTIVQEMENNREDMVVIFAGYPDKMEQFLSRNPGLRSRVPFTVTFNDYSAEELTAIAKSEAAHRGYTITGEAEKKIYEICDAARKVEEFGNGRFSRNLVEAAVMMAASRVMKKRSEDRNFEEFFLLQSCDFMAPAHLDTQKEPRSIGFLAA